MSAIKNINIPQACHQEWQEMTQVNDGRHCLHCCKTVVDFTKMSNDEIVSYLSVGVNVCGRINQYQLTDINHQIYTENLPSGSRWRKWVIAVGVLASTLFFKASAQTKAANPQPIEQGDRSNYADDLTMGKIAIDRVITGSITGDDNMPLPGAIVKVYGINLSTIADKKGNFQLRIPFSTKRLMVSSNGFRDKYVDIDNSSVYHVKLAENVLLGDIVVVKDTSRVGKKHK